jgi:hypothetical protein
MLTERQKNRINALYVEYQKEIKPLTFYVERKFHKFPKGLLKEFRDVFDHISRCYEDGVTEKYKEENIQKAENHFNRIKLDTYKYVSDYKKREFTRWKKKYSKYDLQNINDGSFWKMILDLEDEGEKIFSEARSIEAKDIVESCEKIQESTLKYDEIFQLIAEKRELILKAKFKYRRVTLANRILGFAIGVVASIVAAYLWEMIRGLQIGQ